MSGRSRLGQMFLESGGKDRPESAPMSPRLTGSPHKKNKKPPMRCLPMKYIRMRSSPMRRLLIRCLSIRSAHEVPACEIYVERNYFTLRGAMKGFARP
jgi:hypothetical protein